MNKCLSMEMHCVNISQVSKPHQVPLDFLSSVHCQAWQVSVEKSIDCIILITLFESCVVLKLIYRAWVRAVFFYVVVKIPASVLVKCGEK